MVGVFGFLSEYSLLQSTYRLKDIIDDSYQNDYPFIAINDINNLYGAYKFFSSSKIKPIIGMKLNINHLNKDTSILCYALNDEGYKNLIILSTMVQFKEDNKLEFNEVVNNQTGLYFISSGIYSDIDESILTNDKNDAVIRAKNYNKKLRNFSLGLSLQTITQEVKIAPVLKELSNELNIRLLPLNYMAYQKDDMLTYDAIIQIQNEGNKRPDDIDLSFLTLDEIKNRYSEYPEVFNNLKETLKLFTFKYRKKHYNLPILKQFKDTKSSLRRLTYNGLKNKVNFKNKEEENGYIKRLDYELSVIDELGFNNYFLIVYDFVNYAKNNNILVGPGRGSAAGSLVSYALNITNVDPLKYGLLFERFLNKSRVTMPDIDLDFPDDKREDVIDYIRNLYGSNHVLSINTFSRFSSRAAIRDVCRIKGLSPSETNLMAKRLQTATRLDQQSKEILDLANKFNQLPRQTSTHAAGIVLASDDLRFHVPLQPGPKLFQSQFDHEDLESMGLLKIDLLGIRNLTMISRIVEIIKEVRKKNINLDKIPLNDKNTYDLLKKGDTLGIFQLESRGMRSTLRKLKPESFNDIVALLALYRPGPMENIDEYILRRNGKKFSYIDPILEPILKETYGVIVYQEQIMLIAQKFAGYTLNEADLLRVGIGRKDKDILVKEKNHFINRSIKNNHSKEYSETIYDYIVKFADYGFNKSHSVAYSIIAYQMAYLKANYYDVFMAVYLSYMSSDSEVTSIMNQLKSYNIDIIPPNINKSTTEYVVTDKGLLYPLTSIKGLNSRQVAKILDERNKGSFKNYEDFKNRIKDELTPRAFDSLIFSGALDIFGKTKKSLFKEKDTSTMLYEHLLVDVIAKEESEYDNLFLAQKEKESLGFNLTKSPLEDLTTITKDKKLTPLHNISGNKKIKTAGVVHRINEIKTKKGDLMAFITLTDHIVYVDVTVFNEVYKSIKDEVKEQDMVVVDLNYQDYQGGTWTANNIKKEPSNSK